ncbi:hypothetical protein QTN25_000880 [Entamoeba marina]
MSIGHVPHDDISQIEHKQDSLITPHKEIHGETTVVEKPTPDTTLVDEAMNDVTVVVDLKRELKKREREARKNGIRKRLPRACKGQKIERFKEDPKSNSKTSSQSQIETSETISSISSASASSSTSKAIKEPKHLKEEKAKEKKKLTKHSSKPSKSFKSYSSATSHMNVIDKVLSELPLIEAQPTADSKEVEWWHFTSKWVKYKTEDSTTIEDMYQLYLKQPKHKTHVVSIGTKSYSINMSTLICTNIKDKDDQQLIRRLLKKK